jgi:hypothetical protein
MATTRSVAVDETATKPAGPLTPGFGSPTTTPAACGGEGCRRAYRGGRSVGQ